jgi:hypothetical protein
MVSPSKILVTEAVNPSSAEGGKQGLRFHQFLRASERSEARIESQPEAIEGKERRGGPSRLRENYCGTPELH